MHSKQYSSLTKEYKCFSKSIYFSSLQDVFLETHEHPKLFHLLFLLLTVTAMDIIFQKLDTIIN